MNPPHKKRLPVSPEDWLLHAESDLKLAKLALDQGILPEQICFHAQQAVEKSMKAALLSSSVDFPFSHDLEELIYILEHAGIDLPSGLREAGTLTPYAVESRYPGYWGEIAKNDVVDAIELAEKAFGWAKEFVQKQKPGD